jgi:hypothetical protein
MGKFVLNIGLVGGEEHLCNSCYFHKGSQCCPLSEKTRIESLVECKPTGNRVLYIRPSQCPLKPVEHWIGNEEDEDVFRVPKKDVLPLFDLLKRIINNGAT